MAGVVNDIDPTLQAQAARDAETRQVVGTTDPLKGGAGQDHSQRDWTLRQAAPVPEEPPKEPISKMLIEHMHSIWSASARAVELWFMSNPAQAQQNPNMAHNQTQVRNQDPGAVPGMLAKEVLTYSPSQVKRMEKSESSPKSDSTT